MAIENELQSVQEGAANTERTFHRDEDGRFTSPPAESKEQAVGQPSSAATETKVAAKADAPILPSTEDIQKREYDRLKAKHSETRTSTEPPNPSLSKEATPTSSVAATATATPQPAAGSPSPAQATDNKLPDEYKSVLNLDQYTMLKRVGWLLPADEMKGMGVESLADTIRAARAYRSELDRSYQAQQNQQAQQPNKPSIPSDAGQAPQGISGQAQVQAGQGQYQVRLPDEIEAQLRAVAAEYGEDSPAYMAMRRNEEVRQLQFQQLYQQRQVDSAALRTAVFATAEDNAFASLEKQFPKLKLSPEREEMRTLARAHAAAMFNVGRQDISPQQAIQFVAQARYYPEIQEQERQRLTTARTTSLAGSVERGTPVSKPVTAMKPEEKEKWVYDQLKSGKKRDVVLAEMR